MRGDDVRELHRGRYFALHAQVNLADRAPDADYPQWETGEEPAVFNERGVTVATAEDADVEIVVLEGPADPGGRRILETEIRLEDALVVGNAEADDLDEVPWPPGRTRVEVYVNAPANEVDKVTFVLTRAG
jgi:hypothetical protein